jgi:hypothetical protein
MMRGLKLQICKHLLFSIGMGMLDSSLLGRFLLLGIVSK